MGEGFTVSVTVAMEHSSEQGLFPALTRSGFGSFLYSLVSKILHLLEMAEWVILNMAAFEMQVVFPLCLSLLWCLYIMMLLLLLLVQYRQRRRRVPLRVLFLRVVVPVLVVHLYRPSAAVGCPGREDDTVLGGWRSVLEWRWH